MLGEAISAIKAAFGNTERSCLVDEQGRVVEFDVVETESWSTSASVTGHAVESGANISDHVKVNASSVSLTATITNHTGINSLEPVSLTRVQGLSEVQNIAKDKLDRLEEWRDSGTLLTYVGAVKDAVDNCVITSFSPSKNSGTGDAIELSISLQKVVIARYADPVISLPPSAKSVIKKGRVPTSVTSLSVSSASGAVSALLK